MTVAVIVLLAVLTLELGVLLWALARPLLAIGRAAESGAAIADALEVFVARLTGPRPAEELADNLKGARRE